VEFQAKVSGECGKRKKMKQIGVDISKLMLIGYLVSCSFWLRGLASVID